MMFGRKLIGVALLSATPSLVMSAEVPKATSFGDAIAEGQFSGMLRLRYENVNQDNPLDDAHALTLRTLVGYQTKALNGFSANLQAYAVSPLTDDYNDVKKGQPHASRKTYSVVADPEDYDFHQAYIQWANKGNKIKLGRQNIILDNWRFIGDVRFRQNWAVFNGASYVNTMLPKTKVTFAHFTKVKRVNTKIQDINTNIINANYKITPSINLSGYGYLVELEDAPASSTKTFGVRLNGKEKLNEQWSALFTAEYAKQDDYKGADNIDNDYYRFGAGLGYGSWFLRLDQEKLSAVDSGSTKPFQTTFGTNHLFQGWADLFLSTPNTGIKDTMLIAGGKLFGAKIKAEYHIINAVNKNAAGDDKYGTEFDLGVYYKFKKNIIGSVEYAKFSQKDSSLGKPDTEKFWVTGIYKF